MQNPQRSFSGRRTTGTKTDTLPRTARSWIFLIIIRAHPAGKLGEGATAVTGAELCERLFQSTPPARGGATADSSSLLGMVVVFQSTPPARGATILYLVLRSVHAAISIHAPREGGDRPSVNPQCIAVTISIHAPARGATASGSTQGATSTTFQSTPPARGATALYRQAQRQHFDFNPRPPRGGRPYSPVREPRPLVISIHAPRVGGDAAAFAPAMSAANFNPRPPRGGRHDPPGVPAVGADISIHAPREGGDFTALSTNFVFLHFNPRPPRGGRQVLTSAPSMPRLFQSTPPARGATCRVDEEKPVMSISIHAPREGGDVCSLIVPGDVTGISIHAPREGGDGKQKGKVVDVKISIHAPREGGDSKDAQFYPRIFDK